MTVFVLFSFSSFCCCCCCCREGKCFFFRHVRSSSIRINTSWSRWINIQSIYFRVWSSLNFYRNYFEILSQCFHFIVNCIARKRKQKKNTTYTLHTHDIGIGHQLTKLFVWLWMDDCLLEYVAQYNTWNNQKIQFLICFMSW